jgi:hypothetical protein
MTDELIIDEKNFNQYFFDVRKHKFQKGQIMVAYSAAAEFHASPEKKLLIDLLTGHEKAEAAAQYMRKAFCSRDPDSYAVPRQICEDLMRGMTEDEVLQKPYKYVVVAHFFTKSEYMPKNDPHWSVVSLYDVGEKSGRITSKVVMPEKVDQQ